VKSRRWTKLWSWGRGFGWFGTAGLALAVVGLIGWIVGEWDRVRDVAYSVTLIVRHQWPASLTVLGVAVAMAAAATKRRSTASRGVGWWSHHRWAMLVAVVIVVSVGLAVTIFGAFVLAHLTGYYARPPTEKLSDLIKVALAVSGGVGGAVALVVAYRRQRVTEAAHDLAKATATATEYDAAERRITDLYIKAIEQLGSVKAPVRLGGLYGLERLAQGNPAHRQTVIDVICAYLRMPYTPPESDNAQSVRIMVCDGQDATPRGSDAFELSAPTSTVVAVADPWEEREVRLTAQRMLTQHLSMLDDTLRPDQLAALPPSSERRFWPGLRLNLDRAYLEDFILPLGNIIDGTFASATFAGRTTSFTGRGLLDKLYSTERSSPDRAYSSTQGSVCSHHLPGQGSFPKRNSREPSLGLSISQTHALLGAPHSTMLPSPCPVSHSAS
jgi:hypothetical protein